MKISKKLIDAINSQINAEQWSAQLYLSMSIEAADRSLDGVACWMKAQAKEEIEHSMAMIGYLQERGVRPELRPIAEVPGSFGGVLSMFEQGLEHEKHVTELIENIVAQAIEDKDYGCESFFRGFVTEQEEEESTFCGIIDRLRMVGDTGLLIMDQTLGARK